jgi:hypothetical protein
VVAGKQDVQILPRNRTPLLERQVAENGKGHLALTKRPLRGCGGSQEIVPAALLGGSVNVKTLAFLTEVPDVRSSLGR